MFLRQSGIVRSPCGPRASISLTTLVTTGGTGTSSSTRVSITSLDTGTTPNVKKTEEEFKSESIRWQFMFRLERLPEWQSTGR